tara:strand:+ start:1873 stop:2490 length:618 start_codon:yes stop_codon:yes gene_type:complete
MPTPTNPELYEKVKDIVYKRYDKPSAYRSMALVKAYKQLGGKYADDGEPRNLGRWMKEKWADIGGKEYPVYRPTKRISKDTPLTASEIDPEQAKKQIALKQKIKGDANLPPFIKGEGLSDFSNIKAVQRKANEYDVGKVFPSTKKDKKYMVEDPDGKMIHFGQSGMEDFTYHKDKKRQTAFLNRNKKWKDFPKYTPAFLAYHLLW